MLIAQISDTHVTSAGEKAYGIAPTIENLKSCIHNINQLDPKPDLVLLTGVITNTSQTEEFEQAFTLLSDLEMPYFVIPKNHDNRLRLKTK